MELQQWRLPICPTPCPFDTISWKTPAETDIAWETPAETDNTALETPAETDNSWETKAETDTISWKTQT
jgi:hypothetical protein